MITTNICHICKKEVELKPNNLFVLNGFRDSDTGQICCNNENCKSYHYYRKQKTEFKNMYSELPLIKNQA